MQAGSERRAAHVAWENADPAALPPAPHARMTEAVAPGASPPPDEPPNAVSPLPPPATPPPRDPGWRSGDILRAAALLAALYVGLQLLWYASSLVILAFLGVLFGLAISAGVDRLARVHVPRVLGAPIIVLAFFALLYGFGALIAPTVSEQASVLRARLPEAIARVDGWLRDERHGGFLFRGLIGGGEPAAPTAAPATRGGRAQPAVADTSAAAAGSALREGLSHQLGNATRWLFPFLTSTIAVLAGILIMLFIAIYVAVDPGLYRRGLMHLFPHRSRATAGLVLSDTATTLRKWLITQLIAMIVIGVVTTVVLLALRVKAPFALGLIAGLLEFVPTVGPILSAVPAIAMGFLDSPEKALTVTLAYIVIQQAEGQVLIPVLMKGGMDLPPVLTILSQALMALLFGFLGLMVAVPMLAAVMVPVKMLYVERVVGDDVGVAPSPLPLPSPPPDGDGAG